MRTTITLLLALLMAVLGGGAALAQTDAGADAPPAAFLSMNLKAGFPLDPFIVSINGGGEVDASTLDETCVGFIPAAPLLSVNWEGEVEAIDIFYYSDFDPTLVLQLPDGSYLCNDDASDNLLDPELTVETPQAGQYNLWVGSYDEGQLIPGFLVITAKRMVSVNDFDLGALVQRDLIIDEVQPTSVAGVNALQADLADETQPITADVEIMGGDTPITATLVASGTIPVFTVLNEDDNGAVCGGLVSGAAPEFIFRYSGDAEQLRVFFEGSSDSSLVIVGEETIACSDDSAEGENGNPVIDLLNPSGLYGVWVGRFDETEPITGALTIVESAEATPVDLEPMQPSAAATATP